MNTKIPVAVNYSLAGVQPPEKPAELVESDDTEDDDVIHITLDVGGDP